MSATLESCLYYCYVPSIVAAAIFFSCFTLTTTLHAYQCLRPRVTYFIPFCIGCLFEAIGYLTRMISHFESPTFHLPAFAIQSTLILIAPTLLAASIYLHFDKIMLVTNGESLLSIRVSRFKKIFIIADCFSFLIQLVGSALRLTTSASKIRLGTRLVMTGLGEQMLFLVIFLFVAGRWHWKVHRNPTDRLALTSKTAAEGPHVPFISHMVVLYTSAMLIAVRSLVRLIETLQGSSGILRTNEVFFYVFESAFILVAVILFHFVHPSQIKTLLTFYG